MKKFMDENFMLESEEAIELFNSYAKDLKIIDFHNHLNPKEIYEDKKIYDIADLWLGGDHYKWRLMRAFGTEEKYITGDGEPFEKFEAFAKMIPYSIGNPIYHWTHLELQRYFDIYEPLSGENAREVYEKCNEKLKEDEFSVRGLLKQMDVELLCTTDDPIDDLKYHKLLAEEGYEIEVKPTFRPEKAMSIEKEGFKDYIAKLSEVVGKEIETFEDLKAALVERLDYFDQIGGFISDHSLDFEIFSENNEEKANEIFQKALKEEELTEEERRLYKGTILSFLGKEYAKRNWVMQVHIGALRNNSTRKYESLGADVGNDSMNDFNFAEQLSKLLDELDREDLLPKTILYNLNDNDNYMLVTMLGNFQGGGQKGKMQYGAAWWFLDNEEKMAQQLKDTAANGLVSTFVGMVTDSRSFLSFPRHEYFRRIVCNVFGDWVAKGQYPRDMELVGKMVADICYYNSKEFIKK